MAPRRLPLAHSDDQEQGGHGKVHAGGVHAQSGPHQGAQHRAPDPIDVVQQGHGKVKVVVLHALGGLGGAEQGIGLVRQGKDHIQLSRPHTPQLFNEGQPIDQVTEVHHQGEEGHLGQRGPCGQQRHPQILSRPGIDHQTHKKCPQHIVSNGLEHQAKSHADGQIAHQHRSRHGKRGGKRPLHVYPFLSVWRRFLLFYPLAPRNASLSSQVC